MPDLRKHMTERENRISEKFWGWRNTAMDKVFDFLPRRTAEHLVNAQKEGILAIRSLLDRSIDALDGDLKRVNERPPREQ
jgi:hypothetical protein